MSTAQVDTARPAPVTEPDPTVPRKRRKRAPAAGAADDCFACSNRNVKCDRRRPYCSQCLNDGKDCSGYKTQLTWGVGVASRGKLRGLSLPVAGTQKVAGSTSSQKPKKNKTLPTSQPTVKQEKSSQQHERQHQEQQQKQHRRHRSDLGQKAELGSPELTKSNGMFRFNGFNASPQMSDPFDAQSWRQDHVAPPTIMTAHENIQIDPLDECYPSSATTAPSASSHAQLASLNGTKSSDTYSNSGPISPSSYSVPSPEVSNFGRPLAQNGVPIPHSVPRYGVLTSFSSPFDSLFQEQNSFLMYPRPDESYVRNDAYDSSFQQSHSNPNETILGSVHPISTQQDEEPVEEIQRTDFADECAILDDVSIGSGSLTLDYTLALTPFSSLGSIGKTPRMQYLINYYAEVISPVIVAFDGPTNPYRVQILRLAAESETLQHAISALSASNLRQRRETGALSTGKTDPARRSSMAHLSLTDQSWRNAMLLSPEEQVREEVFHKGFAIQSLNQQLADPRLRKNDAILATLLVLCLFHICDSGVARFQTQFAGVKKLLNLRGSDLEVNNKETKWITRMFTWFDAMAATVNDREGQLQGPHLEISALADEEWALENLAGCDGQLFKTIAKLGRLNVLSQGKSVEESPTLVSRPLPTMPTSLPFHADGGLNTADHNNFDGNGWMRIIADEDFFSSKTSNQGPDNTQTQFWREWREIRQTLQTWQLDMSLYDASLPDSPFLTPEQRDDLASISESFRYSALLYTERLANPRAASTDANIQAWVRQSLNYIKQVKSDVYLLWPLFITGSECVDEADRAVIRERCLDIQKDSGFLNNKSSLELLEKIWKDNPTGPRRAGAAKRRDADNKVVKKEGEENEEEVTGFRFSRVMRLEGNDGEYIVV